MNLQDIYDILVVDKIRTKNPSDKGKPFERMGHKALEPKSAVTEMAVSCRRGRRFLKFLSSFFRVENELFYLF